MVPLRHTGSHAAVIYGNFVYESGSLADRAAPPSVQVVTIVNFLQEGRVIPF